MKQQTKKYLAIFAVVVVVSIALLVFLLPKHKKSKFGSFEDLSLGNGYFSDQPPLKLNPNCNGYSVYSPFKSVTMENYIITVEVVFEGKTGSLTFDTSNATTEWSLLQAPSGEIKFTKTHETDSCYQPLSFYVQPSEPGLFGAKYSTILKSTIPGGLCEQSASDLAFFSVLFMENTYTGNYNMIWGDLSIVDNKITPLFILVDAATSV